MTAIRLTSFALFPTLPLLDSSLATPFSRPNDAPIPEFFIPVSKPVRSLSPGFSPNPLGIARQTTHRCFATIAALVVSIVVFRHLSESLAPLCLNISPRAKSLS